MKRIFSTISTLAFVMFTLSFMACSMSDNFFENACSEEEIKEKIQFRLDEIGEKYGRIIKLAPGTDVSKITEEFFENIETVYGSQCRSMVDTEEKTVNDDSLIDEITVIAAPSMETSEYSGSVLNHHTINYNSGVLSYTDDVTVTLYWTTTSVAMSQCKVIGSVTDSNSSLGGVEYSISNFNYSFTSLNDLQNPSFSYSYTLTGTRNGSTIYQADYYGSK